MSWQKFIQYLKDTRVFGQSLKKEGLPGLGTVLGIITTPLPIAGSLYLVHKRHITPSSAVFGNLSELDHTGWTILNDALIVLTWLRYHPAVCRRIFLSLAAYLHNTRWEVKTTPPTVVPEHANTLPDLNMDQLGASAYDDTPTPEPQTRLEKLTDYLFNCPNRYFMIRIQTILTPILMLTFVSSKGLKGSIPGFADTTELPDWVRYLLQIEFGFHFGQAFTDRSFAALDVLTAKKSLFQWARSIWHKMPQYREKTLQQNWDRFKAVRLKVMNNAGFYRSTGAVMGVLSGAFICSLGFGLNYFPHKAGEKLKGFGSIEDLGQHNELIALAVFYVTTSCGPRIGECIDDIFVVNKRRQTGHIAKNFYRALFTLIFVPIYVLIALICSIPSIHRQHEWRVDVFRDTQELEAWMVFFIMMATAFNFVLPLATRFFGPIGDYMQDAFCCCGPAIEPPACSFTPNFNQQRNTDTENITVEMGNLQLSQDSCHTENELVEKIERLKISA